MLLAYREYRTVMSGNTKKGGVEPHNSHDRTKGRIVTNASQTNIRWPPTPVAEPGSVLGTTGSTANNPWDARLQTSAKGELRPSFWNVYAAEGSGCLPTFRSSLLVPSPRDKDFKKWLFVPWKYNKYAVPKHHWITTNLCRLSFQNNEVLSQRDVTTISVVLKWPLVPKKPGK